MPAPSTYTILHYVAPTELEHAGEAPGTDEHDALANFNRDACDNDGVLENYGNGPADARLYFAGTTFIATRKADALEDGIKAGAAAAAGFYPHDEPADEVELMQAVHEGAELTTAQLEQAARIFAKQLTPRVLELAATGAAGPAGSPHERRIYGRAIALQHEAADNAAGSAKAADIVAIAEAVDRAWFASYQGELHLDAEQLDGSMDTTDHGDLALALFAEAVEQRPELSLNNAAERVAEALAAILLPRDNEPDETGRG